MGYQPCKFITGKVWTNFTQLTGTHTVLSESLRLQLFQYHYQENEGGGILMQHQRYLCPSLKFSWENAFSLNCIKRSGEFLVSSKFKSHPNEDIYCSLTLKILPTQHFLPLYHCTWTCLPACPSLVLKVVLTTWFCGGLDMGIVARVTEAGFSDTFDEVLLDLRGA